jgi:hypothetical protein
MMCLASGCSGVTSRIIKRNVSTALRRATTLASRGGRAGRAAPTVLLLVLGANQAHSEQGRLALGERAPLPPIRRGGPTHAAPSFPRRSSTGPSRRAGGRRQQPRGSSGSVSPQWRAGSDGAFGHCSERSRVRRLAAGSEHRCLERHRRLVSILPPVGAVDGGFSSSSVSLRAHIAPPVLPVLVDD